MLKAADEYLITPLAKHCVAFLLHRHPSRRRSRHLCRVLERTHHQMQYATQHAECLRLVKRRARQVLRNGKALELLCYDCMLSLVSGALELLA